jgi:hypothetical protein
MVKTVTLEEKHDQSTPVEKSVCLSVEDRDGMISTSMDAG